MERAKQIAEIALILAGAFMLTEGGYWIAIIGPQWSSEMAEIHETDKHLRWSIDDANGMINPLRHAVAKYANASDEQLKFIKEQESATLQTTNAVREQVAKVGEVTDSAKIMLIHTEESLNRQLLPQLTVVASHADKAVQTLNGELETLQRATGSANQAIVALDLNWISNPKLKSDIEGSVSDVHGITTDVKIEADRYVAPKTLWRRAKSYMLGSMKLVIFIFK